MARFLYHIFHWIRRRICSIFLAFFFALGLVSGGFLFCYSDSFLLPMMSGLLSVPVSIVGLAGTVALPFLFSALAVSMNQHRLLYCVSFLKAFAFSTVALGVMTAYGGAAWLVLPLLMFSDVCGIPVLWLYWLRCLDSRGRHSRQAFGWILSLLIIGCLDYFMISPFAASL